MPHNSGWSTSQLNPWPSLFLPSHIFTQIFLFFLKWKTDSIDHIVLITCWLPYPVLRIPFKQTLFPLSYLMGLSFGVQLHLTYSQEKLRVFGLQSPTLSNHNPRSIQGQPSWRHLQWKSWHQIEFLTCLWTLTHFHTKSRQFRKFRRSLEPSRLQSHN